MLHRISNGIYIRFLWGLMGIYLLNISIDVADPTPENIPEDLSFNDQESIVEIVLEKVLGFEDALKEYDDNDHEDYEKKKNAKINFLVCSPNVAVVYSFPSFLAKKIFINPNTRLITGHNKIDDPPPQFGFAFSF